MSSTPRLLFLPTDGDSPHLTCRNLPSSRRGVTLENVDATAHVLARLRRFARPMNPDLPAVDAALGDVRRLLEAAGVRFKLVGGLAVVHHGYARTTEDIDVLVESGASARLQPWLALHGFEAVSELRLRHVATGVRVDLRVGGTAMPRAGRGAYPTPDSLSGSPRDPAIVSLGGLLELKMRAGRHRDLADAVELLKRLDDAHYIEAEASMPVGLRPHLAELRRDALDELTGE